MFWWKNAWRRANFAKITSFLNEFWSNSCKNEVIFTKFVLLHAFFFSNKFLCIYIHKIFIKIFVCFISDEVDIAYQCAIVILIDLNQLFHNIIIAFHDLIVFNENSFKNLIWKLLSLYNRHLYQNVVVNEKFIFRMKAGIILI